MLHPSVPATAARSKPVVPSSRSLVQSARALIELTKPRLAVMSVLTTGVAYLASHPARGSDAVSILLATLLSAAGALGLNEWRERDTDAVMRRTRQRPLPTHLLSETVALLWSTALAVVGMLWLAWRANLLAASFDAATVVIYAFVYTPLKRQTRWATEIGAISGALPPLIGSAAAVGHVTPIAALIAGVLMLWQMPHFFAIGWVCRLDYRAAGFPLLPAIDSDGSGTGRWCLGYSIGLTAFTVAAFRFGIGGALFAAVSALFGGVLIWRSWHFLRASDQSRAAKRLFVATLVYLPSVLLALVIESM